MSACLWCEEERISSRRLEPGRPRECPLCGLVFKGHGWDGIDGPTTMTPIPPNATMNRLACFVATATIMSSNDEPQRASQNP